MHSFTLGSGWHRAIKPNEFFLMYELQYEFNIGDALGLEVLVR
ncbi:hypothetical protein HAL1_06200 [Halomonas sp. HAL1]|nr:hypothetical protein HAL1_06200 [Halomonas sp. HAL1]